MGNESLFILHIIIVGCFTFIALRIGREALMTWIALQGILANLFVLKQMDLFGLSVTCSDVYAVGSFLSLNLLQEYFDRQSATLAILIAAVSQAFFMVMSQFHLFYLPNAADSSHEAFSTILTAYPRILIASLCVFYTVQRLDVVIFQALKRVFPNTSFTVRNVIGLSASQTLDTLLFSLFGLWGIVSSLFDIIVMSLTIKLLLVGLTTPFTMSINFFKKRRSEP